MDGGVLANHIAITNEFDPSPHREIPRDLLVFGKGHLVAKKLMKASDNSTIYRGIMKVSDPTASSREVMIKVFKTRNENWQEQRRHLEWLHFDFELWLEGFLVSYPATIYAN